MRRPGSPLGCWDHDTQWGTDTGRRRYLPVAVGLGATADAPARGLAVRARLAVTGAVR